MYVSPIVRSHPPTRHISYATQPAHPLTNICHSWIENIVEINNVSPFFGVTNERTNERWMAEWMDHISLNLVKCEALCISYIYLGEDKRQYNILIHPFKYVYLAAEKKNLQIYIF